MGRPIVSSRTVVIVRLVTRDLERVRAFVWQVAKETQLAMVTDEQVILLRSLVHGERVPIVAAAARAGMSEMTARKYLRTYRLPSELKKPHTWRTRKDPFADVWEEIQSSLIANPNLVVKELFEDLRRRYPGRFEPGQLRTPQRRVKFWRATEGPPKEVQFEQVPHGVM